MLYIRVNSICSSGKVYPLLFGTGTWDLFINDMASFSTGDILIGGKSFSTKSVGEGFVAKLDQYGVFSWQKLYISTAPNEDSIDAVDIYNAYSFATGHSLSGSVNQYFVLKIASDGSIQYNYRVGTDTSNVGTDSIILGMSAVGESQVQVVFDGSVSGSHYIILSTLVMDGSTQESLIGFKGYPSSSGIKSSILSSTAQTIFCVLNNKLLALYYDSTNVYGTQGSYLTNELNTILTSPKTSSMSLKSDQSEGWIVSLSSDSYIYGILTNIAPASALNLARCFKINGFSSAPTKVSVNYIDSTHWIIVSYASGNNGYIMMIDQSTTSTPIIKMRIISGLNNGLIFSRYISSSSSFLIASNLIGGEASGLTKNQGIIYKSGNNFGFTTYNWYDISSTSSLIVQYTPTVYQLSFFDLLTLSGGLVYSTVNQVIGTSSFVKSTTLIPLRPQTMKNNVDGSSCTYFPVDAIYSSGSYQVYSSAPDVSFGSASQCQGISFITSVAIVGKVGTPSWIVYTSSSPALTLKPSVITSKDDLGTFTIVVSFYSSEVSHFISSTTFTATFVNSPPAITNSISNQVLYKGMGLKMISIPSNLFSDSETMTFAVTNNLSGIIPTTFSLSGNILSIEINIIKILRNK